MLIGYRYPIKLSRKVYIKFKCKKARRRIRIFVDSLPVRELIEARRLKSEKKSNEIKRHHKTTSLQHRMNRSLRTSMSMECFHRNLEPGVFKRTLEKRQITYLRNKEYHDIEAQKEATRYSAKMRKQKRKALYEENVKRKSNYCGVITEQELNEL